MLEDHVDGAPARYVDGSEDAVLRVLRGATDRSTGSDELLAAISDWGTEYHLSGDRAALLQCLALDPGRRVLEVGAGTGILTRWLAEQGHRVVAVESSPHRAESAAVRCEGLPDVRVVAGTLADLDGTEPFDLVLLVGVLEYAGTLGLPTAPELLAQCAARLGPGGALVVAIENQLGLQYLAGAPEDHHLRRGVGIEGYPGGGARTYHRRALGALLAGAGLAQQRWLFPYPDYKFPTTILADDAFDVLDPSTLAGLVRTGVSRHHAEVPRTFDVDLAQATLVEAGLGAEVANSFLVVAAPDADGLAPVDPGVCAWLSNQRRRPRWQVSRRLRTDDGALRWVDAAGGSERGEGWLRQSVPASAAFVPGPSLHELAVRAAAGADGERLDEVLRLWLGAVDVDRAPNPVTTPDHPFVGLPDRPGRIGWLASDALDVDLGNFVLAAGEVARIDREWRVEGPIDRATATTRALWGLARHLLARGLTYPGPPDVVVDDLALLLAHRVGLPVVPADLAAWRDAERELQRLVVGSPPELVAGYLDGRFRAA